jgi:hypothetical protein
MAKEEKTRTLSGIQKLFERVSKLEHWQSWLKGGWAFLAAASAYLFAGYRK